MLFETEIELSAMNKENCPALALFGAWLFFNRIKVTANKQIVVCMLVITPCIFTELPLPQLR